MMDSNRNKNEPIPDFQSLPDEEICLLAGAGNAAAEEELVRRYGRLVRACARPLFLAGGDSEDLFQEGMLGLLTAIRSFEGGRDASFRTFAEICIRSRLYSAVRQITALPNASDKAVTSGTHHWARKKRLHHAPWEKTMPASTTARLISSRHTN